MAITDLIKVIEVPEEFRKPFMLQKVPYFSRIEVYGNKVAGYRNGRLAKEWYFKDYTGIRVLTAEPGFPFLQLSFSTAMVSLSVKNFQFALMDTNSILFCCGQMKTKQTNSFEPQIYPIIDTAMRNYYNYLENQRTNPQPQVSSISAADEINKYKALLDAGVITPAEFAAKKKALLGI